MTTLLVGGCGFIGSCMAHYLTDLGEKIVIIDDLSKGYRLAVPLGTKIYAIKQESQQLVRDIVTQWKPDTVMHFAARSVVQESVQCPAAYYNANVAHLNAFLIALENSSVVNFIYSSSAAVYSDPGDPSGLCFETQKELHPVNPYGRSKLMAEQLIRDVCGSFNINWSLLRYFNVCGADRKFRTGESTLPATHLIKRLAMVACGIEKHIDVFGDGSQVRSYVHVDDLCMMQTQVAVAMKQGKIAGEIYNIATWNQHTVDDCVRCMGMVSGQNLTMHRHPVRTGDPDKLIGNNMKIRHLLRMPSFTGHGLETICSDQLTWERKLQQEREATQRFG